MKPEALADAWRQCAAMVEILEYDRRYLNQNPFCEPQLGRRGLYSALGGGQDRKEMELAMLWVLNLSDGEHSLLDIAERSGLSFSMVQSVAATLLKHKLLREA